MTDHDLMTLALAEARRAAAEGEVPVGAVVARRGEVVSAAHNRREGDKNALHHAELLAIDAACRALGGWRLWECELFVTLEPCPMCAGAIVNSRIRRVVYAAPDAKGGCCGSVTDLFALPLNHRPAVEGGLCAEEAAALLAEFFARLRLHPKPRWKKPGGGSAAPAAQAAGGKQGKTGKPGKPQAAGEGPGADGKPAVRGGEQAAASKPAAEAAPPPNPPKEETP